MRSYTLSIAMAVCWALTALITYLLPFFLSHLELNWSGKVDTFSATDVFSRHCRSISPSLKLSILLLKGISSYSRADVSLDELFLNRVPARNFCHIKDVELRILKWYKKNFAGRKSCRLWKNWKHKTRMLNFILSASRLYCNCQFRFI